MVFENEDVLYGSAKNDTQKAHMTSHITTLHRLNFRHTRGAERIICIGRDPRRMVVQLAHGSSAVHQV